MKSKSKNSKLNKVNHPFSPIYTGTSKILILGSMPSPASFSNGFYYMHSLNRFWPLMEKLFNIKFKYKNKEGEKAIEERKNFLLKYDIALWDVIKSCEIKGASDSSIKNAIPNDFSDILNNSEISKIFCTGNTAFKLYDKLCRFKTGIKGICLPSTSPANQKKWPMDKLVLEYKKYIIPALSDKKNEKKDEENE
jgi:hypoxanthine-DNA glycosylase